MGHPDSYYRALDQQSGRELDARSMNMRAKALGEVQTYSHRAKAVRHLCADCNDVNEHGDPAGVCARHGLRCVGCNSEAIEEMDPHEYEDGIPAYWCRACLQRDPEWTYVDDKGEAR